MSTAGKVLVVICTLMILIWIVMMAEVAAVNRNYGEALTKKEADTVKAKQDRDRLVEAVARKNAEIEGVQVQAIKDLTVLRRRVSIEMKALTTQQERLSRVNSEVALAEKARDQAQAEQALREQEKADTEKQIAQLKQDVEQLQAENQARLAQLLKLREEFKTTFRENKTLLAKLRDATSSKVKRASQSR